MTGPQGLDRRAFLATLAAGCSGAVAGCAGVSPFAGPDTPESDSAVSTPTGPGLAGDLAVWGWDVAARSLDLTDDPYEERHGGRVAVTEMERPVLKERFRTAVGSGRELPGCLTMESVDGQSWIATDALRPLDRWIDDAGIRGEFVTAKWEAISRDGQVYALPWDVGPVGAFYRRDVFADHGIDPGSIETWDDFVAAGDALPAEMALLNVPPNDYDGFWRMQLRQLGGQPFTADGRVNIHSETSLRVARNIRRLVDSGVASSVPSWSSEWFEALREGTVASLFAGSWMEGTLRSQVESTSGLWAVMKPPAYEPGGSRATNWGGSNLVVPVEADDATARRALDYMGFTLASVEMQTLMYREYGIFPAYRPAYEHEAFDRPNDFFDGQRVGRLFAEIAPQIRSYRYTVDTPAVSEAINTYFGEMVEGTKTPTEAVGDAAQQVAAETGRELA